MRPVKKSFRPHVVSDEFPHLTGIIFTDMESSSRAVHNVKVVPVANRVTTLLTFPGRFQVVLVSGISANHHGLDSFTCKGDARKKQFPYKQGVMTTFSFLRAHGGEGGVSSKSLCTRSKKFKIPIK